MLGEENSKMVEAQMGIYQDEKKTAYFKSVGDRLLTKLKDKKFAAKVDRYEVSTGIELLGVERTEHIQFIIDVSSRNYPFFIKEPLSRYDPIKRIPY